MRLILSQAELRSQLHYDPQTGVFTRIGRTPHKNCKLGRTLGSKFKNGYLMVTLAGRKYYLHRLAWLYTHGVWPKEIDHINRDRTDNRITNLREVTRTQNNLNSKLSRRNRSGVRGVSWFARDGLWRASISRKGKIINLGHFETVELAAAVRKQAEEELCA